MAFSLESVDSVAVRLREKSLDSDSGKLLISDLRDTRQASDITSPLNCGGYGRVRHFRRHQLDGWPANPLPIDPATRFLGTAHVDEMETQVFQNGACNWRCWYCFVDFALLAGSRDRGAMLGAAELLDYWAEDSPMLPVLDLSGGQPDLVPEWPVWILRELESRGLEKRVYVWSDDNLSNDFFWRYLSPDDIRLLGESPNYGKVCCFKGFDAQSFAFNTAAPAARFDDQFRIFEALLRTTNIDLYAYVTLTTDDVSELRPRVAKFVGRLREIAEFLPLRTVPLPIVEFSPVTPRMNVARSRAIEHQAACIEAWQEEIARLYGTEASPFVCDVPLR